MYKVPITVPRWREITPGTWTIVHEIVGWLRVPIDTTGATT